MNNGWPDKAVNGMVQGQQGISYFHRVIFNPDTNEVENLKPVTLEES